jgi:hypothetical protein
LDKKSGKNHVNVDNDHKLVRKYVVTDASVHDSKPLAKLLDNGNTSRSVWADSAYRSETTKTDLNAKGYRRPIHRKGIRDKPLTAWEKQGNKTRSQTRCLVEHVFVWLAQDRALYRSLPRTSAHRFHEPHLHHAAVLHSPQDSCSLRIARARQKVSPKLEKTGNHAQKQGIDANLRLFKGFCYF